MCYRCGDIFCVVKENFRVKTGHVMKENSRVKTAKVTATSAISYEQRLSKLFLVRLLAYVAFH